MKIPPKMGLVRLSGKQNVGRKPSAAVVDDEQAAERVSLEIRKP